MRLTDDQIRGHAAFGAISGKNCDFTAVFRDWDAKIDDEFLTGVRDALPEEWESSPGDIDRIFEIVKRPSETRQEILEQLWRVVG